MGSVHGLRAGAPVIAVSSLQDAITLTDDLPYGLMASIYTADAGTGLRYADAVRAAWVNVNESSNYWETHLPFGGGGGSARLIEPGPTTVRRIAEQQPRRQRQRQPCRRRSAGRLVTPPPIFMEPVGLLRAITGVIADKRRVTHDTTEPGRS